MRVLIQRFLMPMMACLFAGAVVAGTIELHGVKFDDSATLGGSKLALNGAGTRYKAIFKVYVAGLYLSGKAGTLDEVIALPGPKRMSVTMLREIESAELGKLLTRGMEDNMGKAEMSKMVPGLIRLGQLFAEQKKLGPGDNFTLDWVPGTGSVVTVKGKVQGEPFKEPEFFRALMAIWLGPSPADWKLKDALLNKPA